MVITIYTTNALGIKPHTYSIGSIIGHCNLVVLITSHLNSRGIKRNNQSISSIAGRISLRLNCLILNSLQLRHSHCSSQEK